MKRLSVCAGLCRFRSELCEFSISAMVNEGDGLGRRQGPNAVTGRWQVRSALGGSG